MDDQALKFNMLKEVADASAEGVIIYDLIRNKILYSNRVAFELLGIGDGASKSEVESILGNIAPEDREYVKYQYSTVRKNAVTTEIEFRLMSRQGNKIIICCNAYRVADKSAIVVHVRDITRQKEHDDYLVEFGARKDTVLDVLVHQLSGALNLQRNLTAQADKYVLSHEDTDLKTYFKLLNDNNAHCLEIISDLVKEEHERSPNVTVKNSKIDIVERISIVYEEFRQSYPSRKFLLESLIDKLYINTDVIKMLQVVNNLTSNAIKFSLDEKPIRIRISDDPDNVIVSVADNGIGIPEHLQPLIFQRQEGFGRTGLKGEKSMGRGLFICKHLIALLQGKIWFESAEGERSTFYFSLPKN